jgi:hypothetical protein
MEIIRGQIEALWGLPDSGIAYLNLLLKDRTIVSIPCYNAPIVRALDDTFGSVIRSGHSVNPDGNHIGQEVIVQVGDDGILNGFVPVEMLLEDLINSVWNIDASKLH